MSAQEVLKKLQQIQADNIGVIDCEIQTRKDMQALQIVFHACDYGFDEEGKINKKNRSKLYVHRFKWADPNYKSELELIDSEIKYLQNNYG